MKPPFKSSHSTPEQLAGTKRSYGELATETRELSYTCSEAVAALASSEPAPKVAKLTFVMGA